MADETQQATTNSALPFGSGVKQGILQFDDRAHTARRTRRFVQRPLARRNDTHVPRSRRSLHRFRTFRQNHNRHDGGAHQAWTVRISSPRQHTSRKYNHRTFPRTIRLSAEPTLPRTGPTRQLRQQTRLFPPQDFQHETDTKHSYIPPQVMRYATKQRKQHPDKRSTPKIEHNSECLAAKGCVQT